MKELTETFFGNVETTLDALLLFEACNRGLLKRVTQRLSDSERNAITSGSVYIFDEQESRIKRWTDGKVNESFM